MATRGDDLRRRGLTLLELLISIGLVVAIAALALPSLTRILDDRAFDAGVDTTANHLLLARAHAQGSASPVEVRYRVDPARLEARPFAAGMSVGERSVRREADRTADAPLTIDDLAFEDDGDPIPPIAEAWAQQWLPDDVRLTSRSPIAAADLAFSSSSAASLDEEIGDAPMTIAVFLPDGSALLTQSIWIVDGGLSRIVRVDVNEFTGLPSVSRETDADADTDMDTDSDTDAETEASASRRVEDPP